jgi:hypothetical protein
MKAARTGNLVGPISLPRLLILLLRSLSLAVLPVVFQACEGDMGPAGPPGRTGVLSVLNFIPSGLDTEHKDCAPYVQSALDTGEDVYFPPKKYLTRSPLVLRTSGQIIFGEGRIITTAPRCFLATRALTDVTLRGLTLENLGSSNGGSDTATGVRSDSPGGGTAGFARSDFQDLTLIGFGIGFSLDGVAVDDYEEGQLLGPDGRNRILNCEIRNTLAKERIGSAGGHGIYMRGGYFQISQNRIENMQGGMLLGESYGVVSNNIVINAWDDNGIYISGGTSVSLVGNFIENTKADGIALSSCQRISAIGNTIINAGNGSIRVSDCKRITIVGNNCRGVVTNTFIRGVASASDAGGSEIVISQNIFQGPLTETTNPIVFAPATTPHRAISITNNAFYQINTLALGAISQGPYAIIFLKNSLGGEPPISCMVRDNTFSEVTHVPDEPGAFIRGADESGNIFIYK